MPTHLKLLTENQYLATVTYATMFWGVAFVRLSGKLHELSRHEGVTDMRGLKFQKAGTGCTSPQTLNIVVDLRELFQGSLSLYDACPRERVGCIPL